MLRRTLPAWRDARDAARTAETLVVVVVEYAADGHAIERERAPLCSNGAVARPSARPALPLSAGQQPA